MGLKIFVDENSYARSYTAIFFQLIEDATPTYPAFTESSVEE